MFWPLVLADNTKICFAHTSFKWKNLAAKNAGVTVVIVGISKTNIQSPILFSEAHSESTIATKVDNINAYLIPGPETYVEPKSSAPEDRPSMFWGNKPVDDGYLIMSRKNAQELTQKEPSITRFLKLYYGSTEFISGNPRVCIWVSDSEITEAMAHVTLKERFEEVRRFRASSKAKETRPAADFPHRFRQIQGHPGRQAIIIPIHTSETRDFLPVGLLDETAIVSNAAYALYTSRIWCLSLIASRLHLVWVATVCGKLETRYRYSNTLGWNTFPVPKLTEKNKADLTQCAEDILLAREAHFPATIADLYDPDKMPENLRHAHERNDEVLERIYIGRRFKNDTERLEKLFELYTKMTADKTLTTASSREGVSA